MQYPTFRHRSIWPISVCNAMHAAADLSPVLCCWPGSRPDRSLLGDPSYRRSPRGKHQMSIRVGSIFLGKTYFACFSAVAWCWLWTVGLRRVLTSRTRARIFVLQRCWTVHEEILLTMIDVQCLHIVHQYAHVCCIGQALNIRMHRTCHRWCQTRMIRSLEEIESRIDREASEWNSRATRWIFVLPVIELRMSGWLHFTSGSNNLCRSILKTMKRV